MVRKRYGRTGKQHQDYMLITPRDLDNPSSSSKQPSRDHQSHGKKNADEQDDVDRGLCYEYWP